MLLAALAQAVAGGAVLIVLPLAPGIKALAGVKGMLPVLGYFAAIGVGFMLLEMSFLQRLIRYLGSPIYSASLVIAAFLVFAGLGSAVSRRWRAGPGRGGLLAGSAVAVIATVYLALMDKALTATQAWPFELRLLLAAAIIAPLAFAMGHMLPAAMKQLGASARALVPWAWAVNGFASVAATVAAPLLAMEIGFAKVTLIAAMCYLTAAGLSVFLPGSNRAAPPVGQAIGRRAG